MHLRILTDKIMMVTDKRISNQQDIGKEKDAHTIFGRSSMVYTNYLEKDRKLFEAFMNREKTC